MLPATLVFDGLCVCLCVYVFVYCSEVLMLASVTEYRTNNLDALFRIKRVIKIDHHGCLASGGGAHVCRRQ